MLWENLTVADGSCLVQANGLERLGGCAEAFAGVGI
jgi:hypothetical protein